VKFFYTDPVQDILFPPDKKFVVVRNKKNPVWDILTYRKSYLGNQSIRLFLFLRDSTCHLEMIFLFTEKLYTPFFPHLNHHHTTMSNLDKTFKLLAVLLQLSRKRDINVLQDLQGLSKETYNKILRLAEKHGKVKKKNWTKVLKRRIFELDDEAVSKVTKYNKWLKKKKALAQRALEEDWKGLGFNSKFTSLEAVEAMCKMTSQAQLVNQARNIAKNLQDKKWALKVAPAHNYYMTCMEGDCRFCNEEEYEIDNDYHQQVHQHFGLLHQETSEMHCTWSHL